MPQWKLQVYPVLTLPLPELCLFLSQGTWSPRRTRPNLIGIRPRAKALRIGSWKRCSRAKDARHASPWRGCCCLIPPRPNGAPAHFGKWPVYRSFEKKKAYTIEWKKTCETTQPHTVILTCSSLHLQIPPRDASGAGRRTFEGETPRRASITCVLPQTWEFPSCTICAAYVASAEETRTSTPCHSRMCNKIRVSM